MRIIHCADVHLDSKLDTNYTGDQKILRRAELLDNFADMVSFAAENDVAAIIIAGDLFDRGKVSHKTVSTISGCIKENPGIEFFYLRGNHDMEGNLELLSKECGNLHFFEDDFRQYDLGTTVRIYGSEKGTGRKEELFRMLEQNRNKYNIVTLHGQTVLSATEKCENIDLNVLKNKGIDYLALGHVHKYSEGRLDNRGEWCYPGCLEGRGFDECGRHGFVLLDVDEQTGKCNRRFVEFCRRKILEIKADVTDCEDSNECLGRIKLSADEAGAGAEDLIKVVLLGEREEDEEPDENYIRTRLQRDYYLVRIEDRTSIRIDLEKYRNEISLKGEFVRLVLADSSLDEDMRNAVIRTGFNAFRGEEL